MIKKKYLMIRSIAIASVLLGSLFVSNVLLAQSGGEYDPWIDTNDDGIIDINDVATIGSMYGSSGEPINKTERLLQLEAMIEWLNASLQTDYYNTTECDIIFVDASGDAILGYFDVDSGTLYVDDLNNRVGIGTTSPDAKLCVIENASSKYVAKFIQDNPEGYGIRIKTSGSGTNSALLIWDGSNHLFRVQQDGNVGIGTKSPTEKLEVDGTVKATSFVGDGSDLTNVLYIGYDSDWMDISDKNGQSFNVAHNLNSTDIFVDIQGRTTASGGVHQRHLGGTGYTPVGWNRTYGGGGADSAKSVVQTSDGGYALAGYTQSFGAGNADFWLVKTDSAGNHLWNQTYGGAMNDYFYSMVQTSDGGYALAGRTMSYGAGGWDFWLVKVDSSGVMQWNQTYGGGSTDDAYSVVQTADGGYALAGRTMSYGAGGDDFWLVKTNSSGNMMWNQTYGGGSTDYPRSVVQTFDGGYAIAGYTKSYGIGTPTFANLWLVKTDSAGNHLWNQTYGGVSDDDAYSVVQTADGGYALAGHTMVYDAGWGWDSWLVKVDSSGVMQWDQTYGGGSTDYAYSVVQTADGGYALAGSTYSFGAGNYDFWLVKVDSSGVMQWNQTYGGANSDEAASVQQTSDGGYALAGYTQSFGAGNADFWLVKTDNAGEVLGFEFGLAWTDSTADTVTLYRGTVDPYWNYVRVRISVYN